MIELSWIYSWEEILSLIKMTEKKYIETEILAKKTKEFFSHDSRWDFIFSMIELNDLYSELSHKIQSKIDDMAILYEKKYKRLKKWNTTIRDAECEAKILLEKELTYTNRAKSIMKTIWKKIKGLSWASDFFAWSSSREFHGLNDF